MDYADVERTCIILSFSQCLGSKHWIILDLYWKANHMNICNLLLVSIPFDNVLVDIQITLSQGTRS